MIDTADKDTTLQVQPISRYSFQNSGKDVWSRGSKQEQNPMPQPDTVSPAIDHLLITVIKLITFCFNISRLIFLSVANMLQVD